MINKKILQFGVLSILVAAVVASQVYAFGVASENGPITIYPGETKTINLRLQNMVGDEDLQVKANLTESAGIATLDKTDYFVKLGTHNNEVNITLHVPSNAPINTEYKLIISFVTLTPGSASGVSFAQGIDKGITVLVVAKTPEKPQAGISTITIILIVAAIIIVIIVIILLIRRRKKQEEKKNLINFK